MQFREAGNKIQCLATYYDKEAKRGRQKLVYTLDKYGAAAAGGGRPGRLRHGRGAGKWAKEIVDFAATAKAEADKTA